MHPENSRRTGQEVTGEASSAGQASGMAPGANSRDLVTRCREVLAQLVTHARPRVSNWLDLDLAMGQFKAMLVLTEQRQITVGGLARALGISEPSASLLVDKLVGRGLAERRSDLADRRRTVVSPTDEGWKLVNRLRQTRDEYVASWLNLLSDSDLAALLRGLEALLRAMETAGLEQTMGEEGGFHEE